MERWLKTQLISITGALRKNDIYKAEVATEDSKEKVFNNWCVVVK